MLLLTLFYGCSKEDVDKGWAGDDIAKQVGSGTLKIIDFMNVFLMFIGLIVLVVAIHDLFIVDYNKTRSSSTIAHVAMGIFKLIGGIILLSIKPIAHSMIGS